MKHIIIIFLFLTGCSNPAEQVDKNVTYTKQVVNITMRDGIHLYTEIYTPDKLVSDLPFLIKRSPYGMRHDENGIHSALSGAYKELADEQFIFVFQDIRGRYESGGEFMMLRPARDQNDSESIDEGTDTFDTIEWLLANVEGHNGKAGQLGISYDGWLTVMSLLEPHPALKATSPQASPSDMYIGDDFVHNGALRLSPSFGYAALMESAKTNAPFSYDQEDTYDFFLALGPLSNANERYFHGQLPSWNNFMEHPDYDDYWQELNVDHLLDRVTVPTLNVAGWWDAEDFYGPMKIYETLEKFDSKNLNYLVVGPWRHGGWAGKSGEQLGKINFGSETSVYFKEIQAQWFRFHLKGKGTWDIKEALTFRTGANQWVQDDSWPPAVKNNTRLYLNGDQSLSTTASDDFTSYISDPANPVPYMVRPIPGFWQEPESKYLWKVEDQRFVSVRDDVVSFTTETLREDATLTGEIVAHLVASTSGTDCDWIVKLIDVYPEDGSEMAGFELMIADEVLRSKFRNGFETPVAVPANIPVEYSISLNSRHHTFRKGHKIMVQIQSTWFPLIGRNPQVFVDIPNADAFDYQTAEQRIYGSSYLEIPFTELNPM